MVDVSVEIEGMDRLMRTIARYNGRLSHAVKRNLSKGLRMASNYAIHEKLTGGTSKDRLARRSDDLANSIKHKSEINHMTGEFNGWLGSIGPPYAAIHEYGGVVRARPGHALTIPLREAKTESGAARRSARRYMESKNVFIMKQDDWKFPLIMRKRGKRGKLVPLFVLMQKVTIPARPFLTPSLEKVFAPYFMEQTQKDIDKVWQTA